MGDNLGQALSWWSYMSDKDKEAVIEMAYRMDVEDQESHGLFVNEDEEYELREV